MRDTTVTTRTRLPFPIGKTDQWLELEVKRYVIDPEDSEHASPVVHMTFTTYYKGDYGPQGYRAVFFADSDGLLDIADCVLYPTVGVAAAHLLLVRVDASFLNLPDRAAASWSDLQLFGRSFTYFVESLEIWQQRHPEADRARILAGRDEWELAGAHAAHELLDRETRRRTDGRSFDSLLRSARPYDPVEHRYLDPPFEHGNGNLESE